MTDDKDYKGSVGISVYIPMDLYKRWKERLKRHGDSSRVLVRLIELFLDGKVEVKL
jgi:hypothetical protein